MHIKFYFDIYKYTIWRPKPVNDRYSGTVASFGLNGSVVGRGEGAVDLA